MESSDLIDEAASWNLYFVSETRGTKKPRNVFYKFALIPKGEHGYGKLTCQRKGWQFVGTIDLDYLEPEEFEDRLESLLDLYGDDDDKNHKHIAVKLEELGT